MQQEFLRAPLGKLGTPVCRLGLSASYRPGCATIYKAIDEGINYFFYYGFDTQMTRVLRERIRGRREDYVLGTGGYNLLVGHPNLRRTLEKRLRQVRTDYIDVFHYLGITKPKHFSSQVREELQAIRESGLVRAVAVSCHDRRLAAQLARDRTLDAIMIRYNAAHRGAETEIFPNLGDSNAPVISYTATRWSYLLRRPRGYPKAGRIPSAGMCYRFVLANPAVHVCLTAPSNARQFEENLAEVRKGPLDEDEMRLMRDFGDVVHRNYRYFM